MENITRFRSKEALKRIAKEAHEKGIKERIFLKDIILLEFSEFEDSFYLMYENRFNGREYQIHDDRISQFRK